MSDAKGKLEGLEGFEQLDLGELYFIGGRKSVERGLAYFRQFAVESLEWDPRTKRITASVSGSQRTPYEVTLSVRDGRLEHECDCPAWGTYDDGCKHVIAATAAVFLATQQKSVGGFQMPEDYVQELRAGLGYAEGEVLERDTPREPVARPETTLLLSEVNSYGNLRFEIKGPVPHQFLRSVGITLSNDFGIYGARDFMMGNPDVALKSFVRKAGEQGVILKVKVHGQSLPLTLSEAQVDCRIRYEAVRDAVLRRVCIYAAEGQELAPYALIERSDFVLLESGEVCRAVWMGESPVGELGPVLQRESFEDFNATGYAIPVAQDSPELRVEGKVVEAHRVHPEAMRFCINLGIWKNAASEPEVLEFSGAVELEGFQLQLTDLMQRCLAPIIHAYAAGLFSAKRRVRALLDLIRCLLADGVRREDLDLSDYREDFPELAGNDFRGVVHGMLANLLGFLEGLPDERCGLAWNEVEERWCAHPLDVRRVAMLLFSMADLTSRKDLLAFEKGKIPIVRGTSGMDQVQAVVSAARVLGVEVRFDEKPIHTKPLSISVDTRASGSDIDWFALHPSIRCDGQSIQADEWQQLVRGQLMLKGKDGSLILPEVGEGSEEGLQVLASMLREKSKPSDRSRKGGAVELQVSRLEMLDWMLLRKHGVNLRLPQEAEDLFQSLSTFDSLGEFEPPVSLNASLRPYQLEGCAWIDFLYRHRFGACLADDMGLGKTVQAIGFIAKRLELGLAESEHAPVLIVLPPSLVFNWQDEFARFAPSIKVEDCLRKADWAKLNAETQVVLTTYDRVRLDQDVLAGYEFEIVVFDEAHNLKSVTAARTKAANKLKRRFTLCLTGTPVENNASEFYSVLSASVPGIFGTLQMFRESFRLTPSRILGRARPFILRRTKQAILTELPKKEEHELFLEMSTIQKEIYTRTVAEVKEEVAEAYADRPEQQAGIVALAAILRLRQVCVSPELLGKQMSEPAPKFEYMADKLEELEAEGHAALVFSQFIGGLDQMEQVAQARGIRYLRMDGRTPVAARKDLVRAFQSGEGPSFFFISLKTGGVGLNLTQANYVFHLDPWWNPAVENQASDRAHRIGQTRSVFVQRLIMQHSIEARMLDLKARKAELFRQLVEQPGEKTASAGLNRADFDFLLNG